MKKNLNDRFQLYNKGMELIDWNDVLRKKNSDIKYNDSVKRAKGRHDVILRKEKKIDEFIKSEPLRDVPCDHKNYSHKGHLICAVCGLMKKDFNPFAFNEGMKTECV